jgi:TolB-like protein/tetratricopeptide (TPR) repeat protein
MSAGADGQVLVVPERLREALADRYPIERPLGRGGMATVYLARDLKHHRSVAVKVLHVELAAGLGSERFLREIRIEASLQHPHILPLHDSGEAAGFLYYVMPFVAGESLRQRLTREGRLSLEDTLRITSNVADALAYAHAHGVVHRDIKPENILLSNGHALVADFGIAKAVEAAGDSKLTETGWGMGTPAYMSPEQIVGGPADGRSDIYGLGCVVYEMLTGHPPFAADNARAMFTQHQVDTPPPISTDRPDVPKHVQDAVLTALAKRPADRFSTSSEFAERLTLPGGRKVLPRMSRARARPRRRTLIAVAGAALLLGGGWFYLRAHPMAIRGGRDASLAVMPIADLDGDTSQAYVSAGLTEELITDLAQSRHLRVINRLTMETYRRRGETPQQIARALGVDAMLTSSLQRIGDSLHFTAQLIPKGSDRATWAGGYSGTRADLLRIQREIAWTVAERLMGARGPSRATALAGDPDAVDAYIRGRYWWGKRNPPSLLRAIQFFGQALDADPRFAPAYAGMADAYIQLGYQSILAPDDAFPKAAAAAHKALELDSTLAEPHASLAFFNFYYNWDWKSAEQEFQLAIAKNPSYATAHEWYGLFLAAMGRFDEAHHEEGRAQALDPLSIAITATNAWVYHYSGRHDEAERLLRQALRTDSTFGIGRFYLGRVLQAKGELDSASAEYGRLQGPMRQWVPTVAALGNLYGVEGKRADALALLRRLDSLSRTQYVTSYGVALVHAALGQPDSAFSWLDRAVQERTHWLVWLRRDPRWERVRGDPRYGELVRRLNLPP